MFLLSYQLGKIYALSVELFEILNQINICHWDNMKNLLSFGDLINILKVTLGLSLWRMRETCSGTCDYIHVKGLHGDVPRSTSYGVYISQLILFARASSYVADFNTRNKLLTQKLLKQGYRYHKLRKTFSKFYR